MGNRLTKEQKIEQQNIKAEWDEKRRDRLVLLIGDAKCGKTKIINTLVNQWTDNDSQSIKDLDWANSQYLFNGFTINQYYPSVECACSNYKYLNIVLNNIKIEKPNQLNYNDPPNDLINSEYASNSTYKSVLVSGLYRAITGSDVMIPKEIVSQICQFIPNPFLSSYIFRLRYAYFEFWDSSVYDIQYLSLLYKYVHSIIFVANISQLHTLNVSLDLFDGIVKECRKISETIRPSIFVFLTESNILKTILSESVDLNEYEVFGDYKDTKTNSDNMSLSEKVISFIKHKFEKIMDGYGGKVNEYTFLTNVNDQQSISKVFWYCEAIIFRNIPKDGKPM